MVRTVNAIHHAQHRTGADFAVLVCELEGLNKTQHLVYIAADWVVVDGDVAQDALGINDEGAAANKRMNRRNLYCTHVCLSPKSVSVLGNVNTVVLANLLREVGQDGNVHGAKTPLLSGLVDPRQVGEVAVNRRSDNLSAYINEPLFVQDPINKQLHTNQSS